MSEFDEKARGWDKDPERVRRAEAVAEAVLERVRPSTDARVFDFGCGTGLLGFALLPHVGHVTFADDSEGMLAIVREKIEERAAENAEAMLLDLTTDPPPDRRFDLVVSLMALHHIKDTDMILRRLHTLCGAGGRLCLVDLDREDGSFHDSGFTGHHGFDRENLAGAARRAGFHPVSIEDVFEIVRKEADGSVRRFPLFLMNASAGQGGG
jgi:ubiquinone/menaquinone biosynthesis C-methylase UbiE